jgi:ribosomal-protein-alanine N-acetyltransferase
MIGILSTLFRAREPAISDARPTDAAALAAVHARAFRHGWSESEFEGLLSDPQVTCHLARDGRAITGFILSRAVEDEAEILMVAVDPSQQGRGLGRRLLARHLGRLAARGARRVFLEVDEGNGAALRLYTRAGFAKVGRRPGYYPSGENRAAALILRRDIV